MTDPPTGDVCIGSKADINAVRYIRPLCGQERTSQITRLSQNSVSRLRSHPPSPRAPYPISGVPMRVWRRFFSIEVVRDHDIRAVANLCANRSRSHFVVAPVSKILKFFREDRGARDGRVHVRLSRSPTLGTGWWGGFPACHSADRGVHVITMASRIKHILANRQRQYSASYNAFHSYEPSIDRD